MLTIQFSEPMRNAASTGQPVAFKQSYEHNSERLETLEKLIQDALSTDRVPDEQRTKIDHFVTPEAPPCKAYLRSRFCE